MNARERRRSRQATKADMLDTLAQTVLGWDPLSDSHGLTAAEFAEVQSELANMLYAWAVRITPKVGS